MWESSLASDFGNVGTLGSLTGLAGLSRLFTTTWKFGNSSPRYTILVILL